MYFLCLTDVLSDKVEGEEFITYTAVSYQGVIKMFWLYRQLMKITQTFYKVNIWIS